jgi:NUMOD3 motif
VLLFDLIMRRYFMNPLTDGFNQDDEFWIGIARTLGQKPKGELSPNHGRRHSEEMKKEMSQARMGPGNPMYGRKLLEEHKKAILQAISDKKIPWYDLHPGEKHFNSGRKHSEE